MTSPHFVPSTPSRSQPVASENVLPRASDPDVSITAAEFYLLPVEARVPLKFGAEILSSVTCARARVQVMDSRGCSAWGWGETPLSVQWAWPGELDYRARLELMVEMCRRLTETLVQVELRGHPLEIGCELVATCLPRVRKQIDSLGRVGEKMSDLAALVCLSPFDIALHDAYGVLHSVPTYETYCRPWMNRDLSSFLESANDSHVDFRDKYPQDFLEHPVPAQMVAWHLVGGLDALGPDEVVELPGDDLPAHLEDWIECDELECIKIKLRGTNAEWDFERIVRVGRIALARGVRWLSTDFNCTVKTVDYVTQILDRLAFEQPEIYALILYVEQPFAVKIDQQPADVHDISRRKPLFLDESAHNWRQVMVGRERGWTGVALKTCKTQTEAILSLCWAKAHGMLVMVQDLTNPMLAQIPHVLLAAHAGTLMGVESNSMQFYPQASSLEAAIHRGLYTRRGGKIDLSTLGGPGFGYRGAEAARTLPEPAATFASPRAVTFSIGDTQAEANLEYANARQ